MRRAPLLGAVFAVSLHTASALAIDLRVEGARLVVTGPIEFDDDFKLLAALITHAEQVRIVHFDGMPGGEMQAALRMGKIIREYQLDTISSGGCFSGCNFAFLGGVNRRFAWDGSDKIAIFGIHAPRDPLNRGDDTMVQTRAVFADYIAEMTGNRADRALIERSLRLRDGEWIVFLDTTRRWFGTPAVECPSSATINEKLMLDHCTSIPGTSAWQQGWVTNREAYRLPASRP